MKKIVAVAILLLVCAVMASADADNWRINIRASNILNDKSGSTASIGCQTGYTDDVDFGENQVPSNPPPGQTWYYATSVFPTNGLQSVTDYRAPLALTPFTDKEWNIKAFYINAGAGPGTITKLTFGAVDGFDIDWNTMKLTVSWSSGKLNWQDSSWTSGEMVFDNFNRLSSWALFVPGKAQNDPAMVNVRVSPVPEPGSMLALGTGLIGLVGFTIRRRR